MLTQRDVVDVLDTFETIKVAVKYVTPDGQALYGFPADLGLVSLNAWVDVDRLI
jgi:adenylosuccinate synthase